MYWIGHPVYTWPNHSAYAATTAAAVRELRSRGVKRDKARQMCRAARAGSHATGDGGLHGHQTVELIYREQ